MTTKLTCTKTQTLLLAALVDKINRSHKDNGSAFEATTILWNTVFEMFPILDGDYITWEIVTSNATKYVIPFSINIPTEVKTEEIK